MLQTCFHPSYGGQLLITHGAHQSQQYFVHMCCSINAIADCLMVMMQLVCGAEAAHCTCNVSWSGSPWTGSSVGRVMLQVSYNAVVLMQHAYDQ